MGARFHSWWQYIRKHWLVAIIIVFVVLMTLIFIGYRFDWTGFNGYTQVTTAHTTSGPSTGTVVRTEVYQPGKALWDWMQLLIIPVVLAVGALLFNLATTRTEQQIALDKQREDLLQAYLDRMSELLLKENLRSSAVEAEVRNVARVRTTTVICQLNPSRVSYVFAFLREAGLMSAQSNSSIVGLCEADLRTVNWSQANLSKANLSKANLSKANLSGTTLSEANLSGAYLNGINLSGANLIDANLREANLRRANLRKAILIDADLSHANLGGADLRFANLFSANLSGANLGDTDLSHADFSDADLFETFLKGANLEEADFEGVKNVFIEELEKQAKSLKGATMPDGSKHA